jgi:2-methylcitrate dehydratase PrpD
MILRHWAERLLQQSWSREEIDLHVNDTVAAFLVGCRSGEGQALCRFYGARREPSEWAAAAAAIARLSECDDIHPASCITPGAVVVPVVLELAKGRRDDDVYRAIAAGAAAGLSLGVSIGGAKALACGVWPTLAAAPLMAAVAAACLAGCDADHLMHAMALGLAGASGRLGRPMGSPSGRWFLLAEAVLRGLGAARAAGQGFRGDPALLSPTWLAALAGHEAVDVDAFATSGPVIGDVDFKPFPIARQGANAVAGFRRMLSGGLDPRAVTRIEVFVPAMNVALLNRPPTDDDRLSRLCNMGFQLACAALAPELLDDPERGGPPAAPLLEFARCVSVTPASDLDAWLPGRWPARIVVYAGGERLEDTIVHTAFDRDAPDLAQNLRDKAYRLLPPHEARAIFGGDVPSADLWQRIEQSVRMA